MNNRSRILLIAIITSLPAFSQSREVLVSADSVSSSIFGALDFVDDAYEDNSVVQSLSSIPFVNHATTEGVLDMLVEAYNDSTDLFKHKLTSPFGFREEFGRMHWGVDLSMKPGEGIPIPLGGTVVRTGYDEDGYGYFVIVAHPNSLETRYAHLKEILVHPGDTVYPGTIIATSGNSGNSTAPHLHFEIRRNGLPVNPTQIFPFRE